jgi:hypothetical protein
MNLFEKNRSGVDVGAVYSAQAKFRHPEPD